MSIIDSDKNTQHQPQQNKKIYRKGRDISKSGAKLQTINLI